jgi:hypothetical protein
LTGKEESVMDPEIMFVLMKLEERSFEKNAALYRLTRLTRTETPRLRERFLGAMKALWRVRNARWKALGRPIVPQRIAYR